MRRLQQGAVAAARDDQIRLFSPHVAEAFVQVSPGVNRFDPFVSHAFARQNCPERARRFLRMRFSSIDDDDDLADFHGLRMAVSPAGQDFAATAAKTRSLFAFLSGICPTFIVILRFLTRFVLDIRRPIPVGWPP